MNKTYVNFAKSLLLVILMCVLVLSGCGKQAVEESFTKYSCSKKDAPEAVVYVQLDINPSFIIGLAEDGTVVSIEANNADAEDVLINYLGDAYFNSDSTGLPLDAVIQDLAVATKNGGYIDDTFEVEVIPLSGNMDEQAFDEACEMAASVLSEEEGITASFEYAPTGEDDAADEEGNSPTGEEENDNVCDLCGGSGEITCDLCNGTGTVVEIRVHEEMVRNDYVCPYCGGAGILDDGMHGGETAPCDYCGAATGVESGDFREKAYDKVEVEEEETLPCNRCGGSGKLKCNRCSGTGVINGN